MSRKELICIICPTSCKIVTDFNKEGEIENITGFRCKRGKKYVEEEVMSPTRTLTSIVRVRGGELRMCPIRSSEAIPKRLLLHMAESVSKMVVEAPVNVGDVIVRNIMGTGSDIIATRKIDKI